MFEGPWEAGGRCFSEPALSEEQVWEDPGRPAVAGPSALHLGTEEREISVCGDDGVDGPKG